MEKNFDEWNKVLTTKPKIGKSKICLDEIKYPEIFANISQLKTIDSKRLSSKMFFLDRKNFKKIKRSIRKFNDL